MTCGEKIHITREKREREKKRQADEAERIRRQEESPIPLPAKWPTKRPAEVPDGVVQR